MSHKEMHCLRSYFSGMPISATIWLLKQVKQISANKENFDWPNWVETFLKWKAKATYDRKKLGKKGEGMSGNFNLFNSRKPNSIKRPQSAQFKDAGGG